MNWRRREGRRSRLVLCMRPTFCLVARVYKSFMANKEITSRKSFRANVAYESAISQTLALGDATQTGSRLLFRVGTDMALQVFESCKQTLTMSISKSAGASIGRVGWDNS
jgi:hypothetical protein